MPITEVFSLYRRSDLWIKEVFDPEFVDNINEDKINYVGSYFSLEDVILDANLNIRYWALRSSGWDGGWLDFTVQYLPDKIHEYNIIQRVKGSGSLSHRVNLITKQSFPGPFPWKTSFPYKLFSGDALRISFSNPLQDSRSCGELSEIDFYYYDKLDCEMFGYTPPTTEIEPKVLNVIRGYNAVQTTQYLSTVVETSLRFYTAEAHTDFVRNAEKVHILCDEKGVLYRGVIALGKVKWFGEGLYEQEIKFISPYKLGEGW